MKCKKQAALQHWDKPAAIAWRGHICPEAAQRSLEGGAGEGCSRALEQCPSPGKIAGAQTSQPRIPPTPCPHTHPAPPHSTRLHPAPPRIHSPRPTPNTPTPPNPGSWAWSTAVHAGDLPPPLSLRGMSSFSFLPQALVCKVFPSMLTKAEQIEKNKRSSVFLGLHHYSFPSWRRIKFFLSTPDS